MLDVFRYVSTSADVPSHDAAAADDASGQQQCDVTAARVESAADYDGSAAGPGTTAAATATTTATATNQATRLFVERV